MSEYKGITLNDNLIGLIQHMEHAEEYRETLQNLQFVWDNLTLLGQLSGTSTDMSNTRQAFQQLTSDLLNNLGSETLKKTVLEMKSKAQIAVDIMIRNLFERTADIGFLATDDDLRQFLINSPLISTRMEKGFGSNKTAAREELEQLNARMVARFREYVIKYSVYSNIIVMDTTGNILVQLDADNPARQSSDPLIQESLTTSREYVETFRYSDLLPGEDESLIYSYRVTSPVDGAPIGVLCLCFRFNNETEGIFKRLKSEDDWAEIMLLDAQGVVIASSDIHHIPLGARFKTEIESDFHAVRFGGRTYLACTRPAHSYQGYKGPGWYGHVMLPVDNAFSKDSSSLLKLVQPEVLQAVMSNPSLFSASLRNIPLQADEIQSELNRSVWNGNVRQRGDNKAGNASFTKILLWEISNTGVKTKDVFERSISNLHETVVSAILQDSQHLAALAIDIMDRNLYERANDSRWWALTSKFRRALAESPQAENAASEISEILRYINGLYTVYDNLLVFDRVGRTVAVSNPDFEPLVGKQLGEDWVKDTLSLENSQSYTVSTFEPTPLYYDRHTYIYAAAIRNPENSQVVGGIGIVFDSTPQFEAMLLDSLPRNEKGEIKPGCFGIFADRKRRVIASTEKSISPGSRLDLDEKFFNLGHGEGISNIIIWNGKYCAVGSRMSSGYREYKDAEDRYQNDVIALIVVPLCTVGEVTQPVKKTGRSKVQLASSHHHGGESVEIATFHIAETLFGLRTEHVVEAIDAQGITAVPGSNQYLVGYLMYQGNPLPVIELRWLLKNTPMNDTPPERRQIVVMRYADDVERIGLIVDALGEIPEVPVSMLQPLSSMLAGENVLADSIVRSDSELTGANMILVLNPDRIAQRLRQQIIPAAGKVRKSLM